jgi:hypothetical protein
MRLWTIQDYKAYEVMLEKGVMNASNEHLFCEDDFRHAYAWMSTQMRRSGLIPPVGVDYPIWAWYKWDGKRKRRDMRERSSTQRNAKIIQLTIEIDDSDVLLSDFHLFHYVLNYWYLPIDEKDSNEFENEYTRLGFAYSDLSNFEIQNQEMKRVRTKIERSWDRVLDLQLEDDDYIYGINSEKSIQATFWQLKTEQIVKAEVYPIKLR